MLPFESRKGAARQTPAQAAPSGLLKKIIDAQRPHETVQWIRCGEDGSPLGEFELVALSQTEVDRCRGNAEKYATELIGKRVSDGGDGDKVHMQAWEEVYNDGLAVELLFACCRDKDDIRKPLFLTPDIIRDNLTVDEIVALYNAYKAMLSRHRPEIHTHETT